MPEWWNLLCEFKGCYNYNSCECYTLPDLHTLSLALKVDSIMWIFRKYQPETSLLILHGTVRQRKFSQCFHDQWLQQWLERQGRSQDFHKGGAQLDGVVIASPRQSRAWPALLAIGGGCGSFWHFSWTATQFLLIFTSQFTAQFWLLSCYSS